MAIFLKVLGSLIVLLFPIFLLSTQDSSIFISFLLLAPILAYMVILCINEKSVGFGFCSVTVFCLLFFYIAPILQIRTDPSVLVNTMPFNPDMVLAVNLYILMFMCIFIFAYLIFKRRFALSSFKLSQIPLQLGNKAVSIIVVLSGIIALWALVGIDFDTFTLKEVEGEGSLIASLFKHKVMFLIPFLGIAILPSLRLKARSFWLLFPFLLLCLLSVKNPLYDRRNSLGPVYLSLAIIYMPYFFSSTRRYFISMLIVIAVLFPVSSLLTHTSSNNNQSISLEMAQEAIKQHFLDVHYDAWANFFPAIEIVDRSGLKLGDQVMGSILFFYPRSIWEGKPVASGEVIGNYLMDNYNMWFNNLSCAFPIEGYLDFGIAGVIIFALMLALFVVYIDRLISIGNITDKVFAIYMSFYLFFILRGSLLPAVAYGVGAFGAIKTIPFIINKIVTRMDGIQC
ncbi:MAG: hypothetical protein ACXVCP_07090 [Bdellovibrio sp.]